LRYALVAALLSYAGTEARTRLRCFLAGLSADELEFLAGFQGARILERSSGLPSGAADYASWAAGRCAADLDHKMLVLREYLVRCGSRWAML
jgi:hypothetical protein